MKNMSKLGRECFTQEEKDMNRKRKDMMRAAANNAYLVNAY